MRGDLDKITLSDIFQTLAMSKMEGILVVFNPLEQRGLYFRDGTVRDLVFGRPEHRRLGEQLRRAGFITADQLRSALIAQEQSARPLGELLCEQGAVSPDDLEDMAKYQATEDMHSLFTWKHGTFEFYKGAPEDPRIRKRIEIVPEFKVDAILLEAARRSDEWAEILAALHSADEILRRVPGADVSGLDGDYATVMAAVDGARSIRDLTNHTILGVFHCAHVCKQLVEWGLAEPVGPLELLAAAERHRAKGEVRRAVVALRTLFDREEPLDLDTVREMAAAMERCGDSRFAGRTLWRAAQEPENDEHALDLIREACRIDTRSSYLLRSLQHALQRRNAGGEELADVTSRLADALVDEDNEADAVVEIERLETICTDPSEVLSRKARVLQRLGRQDEAVAALEQLALHLEDSGNRSQLIKVYEQILMLDGRRRDIAKVLARLKTTKRVRQVRLAATIAVCTAIGAAGVAYFENRATAERLQMRLRELNGQVESGQLAGVEADIDATVADFGAHPALEAIRARVIAQRERLAEQRESDRQEQVRVRLATAADHIERGALREALDIYRELMANEPAREQALAAANNRVGAVVAEIGKLAATLPERVPAPPTDLLTGAQREAVLAKLRVFFRPADLELARGIQQVADHPLLLDLLGLERRVALTDHAAEIEAAFIAARTREAEYRAAQRQFSTKQQLQPVFLEAQRQEEVLDFPAALETYRRLAEDYPDEDRHKAGFRDKVERYAWICERLAALADATTKGQHRAALDQLAQLRAREPKIAFERVVRLPIKIESTPPGAVATIDDEAVGRTPLLASYAARGRVVVRVHLPGFLPQQQELPADFAGHASLLLSKAPDWSSAAPGAVERQPVCDGEGHAVVVDRSGTVIRLSMESGDVAWRYQTSDLSGLLTRPVLAGTRVLVGSFDGPLRALDGATGGLDWQLDDLPCESSPALVGSVLVAATIDGEAVGVRTDTGEALYRARLPGSARSDVAANGQHALVATRNGWIVCLSATSGKVVWSRQVADSIAASPAVGAGIVVVASDEGTVLALDARDGRSLWQQTGLGELTLPPALVGSQVVVADASDLHTFGLRDGRRGPRLKGERVFTSAPVAGDGKLFIGDQAGVIHVLDPESLRRRYALGGKGKISAPLAIGRGGQALAAFESKILQGFRQLP